jgi:hypothetical protein
VNPTAVLFQFIQSKLETCCALPYGSASPHHPRFVSYLTYRLFRPPRHDRKVQSFITLPPSPFENKHYATQPVPRSQPLHTPSSSTDMYHPSQMSGPQSPPIQPGPPGGMQHHYPPPPGSEPTHHEAQASSQYPHYSYDIQLKFPPQHQQENQNPNQQYNPAQGLPLPSMSTNVLPPPNHGIYAPMPPREPMSMDTTGQLAPPGMKPRVTATLWEDEGTLCFQVDVKGTCVARREGISLFPPPLNLTTPLVSPSLTPTNPPLQTTT